MNTETIKAVVSSAIVVIVAVFASCGVDVDGDSLTNVVSAAVLIVATGYGCWKNHNFTEAAQKGQELVNEIKGRK